jgi:serine/threonine-protein kinase
MTNTGAGPTRIGPVIVERTLGVGGMGQVFAGRDPELDRKVAVKTLLPHLAQDAGLRERFLREARAMARISHPNVVQVFEVGEADGSPYLVMELLSGETLESWMRVRDDAAAGGTRASRRLPIEEALDLLLPAIAAVAAGHDSGVIHRDLTPRNIFRTVSPRGEVTTKVLDFGIAKVLDDRMQEATALGARLGTLSYMSPEQMAGERVDPATDQFSLAAILYEALSARRARPGATEVQAIQAAVRGVVPLREVAPEVPAELEAVIMRALAAEPHQRHRSLDDFARALLPFAGARARARWEEVFAAPPLEDATGATQGLGPASRRAAEGETQVPRREPPTTVEGAPDGTEVLGPKPSTPSPPAATSRPPSAPAPSSSAPPLSLNSSLPPPVVRTAPPSSLRRVAMVGPLVLALVAFGAWWARPRPQPHVPDGRSPGPAVDAAPVTQTITKPPPPTPSPEPPPAVDKDPVPPAPDPTAAIEAAQSALARKAAEGARACSVPYASLKVDFATTFKVKEGGKIEATRLNGVAVSKSELGDSMAGKAASCVLDTLKSYRASKAVPPGSKLTVRFAVGMRPSR